VHQCRKRWRQRLHHDRKQEELAARRQMTTASFRPTLYALPSATTGAALKSAWRGECSSHFSTRLAGTGRAGNRREIVRDHDGAIGVHSNLGTSR
jgi:hypothetical protein